MHAKGDNMKKPPIIILLIFVLLISVIYTSGFDEIVSVQEKNVTEINKSLINITSSYELKPNEEYPLNVSIASKDIIVETREGLIQITSKINSTNYQVVNKRFKWDYLEKLENASDIVRFSNPIIILGNKICDSTQYREEKYGNVTLRKHYLYCIEYPHQLIKVNITNQEDDSGKALKEEIIYEGYVNNVKVGQIDKFSANVTFNSPYDPIVTNFTTGLQFCYSFNNETGENDTYYVDHVSGSYNATGYNGPVYNTTAKLGYSLIFDKVNDYVYSNGTYDDSLDNLESLTVMAWVRPKDSGEGTVGKIAHKSVSTGPNNGWSMQFNIPGGGDETAFGIGFHVAFTTQTLRRITSAGTIKPNSSYHVAVVWNGSNSYTGARIYINGSESTYAAASDRSGALPRIDDSSSNISIGNNPELGRTTNGEIDEVMIWNYNMTSDEISTLYNNFEGVTCNDILRYDECIYGGGDWIIDSGGICYLSNTKDIGPYKLIVINGRLRITGTGRLHSAGCYAEGLLGGIFVESLAGLYCGN